MISQPNKALALRTFRDVGGTRNGKKPPAWLCRHRLQKQAGVLFDQALDRIQEDLHITGGLHRSHLKWALIFQLVDLAWADQS